MTGQTVRLPSEAEWEYACRAGSTGNHCFGDDESKYRFGDYESDDESKLGSYAWYGQNSDKKTHPVGKKSSNAWGLRDRHVNVWVWCEDIYHENYQGAPSDGIAWINGGDRDRKVLRGGSWFFNGIFCRSAKRDMNNAVDSDNNNGFRVVV